MAEKNDAIDIRPPEPHEIAEIEPAAEEEPLPVRSLVLYHPDDREEVVELIDNVKSGSRKDT